MAFAEHTAPPPGSGEQGPTEAPRGPWAGRIQAGGPSASGPGSRSGFLHRNRPGRVWCWRNASQSPAWRPGVSEALLPACPADPGPSPSPSPSPSQQASCCCHLTSASPAPTGRLVYSVRQPCGAGGAPRVPRPWPGPEGERSPEPCPLPPPWVLSTVPARSLRPCSPPTFSLRALVCPAGP